MADVLALDKQCSPPEQQWDENECVEYCNTSKNTPFVRVISNAEGAPIGFVLIRYYKDHIDIAQLTLLPEYRTQEGLQQIMDDVHTHLKPHRGFSKSRMRICSPEPSMVKILQEIGFTVIRTLIPEGSKVDMDYIMEYDAQKAAFRKRSVSDQCSEIAHRWRQVTGQSFDLYRQEEDGSLTKLQWEHPSQYTFLDPDDRFFLVTTSPLQEAHKAERAVMRELKPFISLPDAKLHMDDCVNTLRFEDGNHLAISLGQQKDFPRWAFTATNDFQQLNLRHEFMPATHVNRIAKHFLPDTGPSL